MLADNIAGLAGINFSEDLNIVLDKRLEHFKF